jgi:DNA-directed RNA polymerase specialized sigma24 family protein
MNQEVTLLLEQLKGGDQAAQRKLWEGYFARLTGLARKRLRGAPCQEADEEDVVNSVFKSFFRCVDEARFPQLFNRDDLWQVLVMLTLRKSSNLARRARTVGRGRGQVKNASALDDSEDGTAFTDLATRELEPDLAAEMADQCRHLLDKLPNDSLRTVALWKLDGHSNEEIASKLGRSLATIGRKLADIRTIWEKMAVE